MLATALKAKFPNAACDPSGPMDIVVQDDGNGPYIAFWNEKKLGRLKPASSELTSIVAEFNANPPAGKTTGEKLAALGLSLEELKSALKDGAEPVV